MKPGRNDPCSCGSGKEFEHCCEGKVAPRTPMPSPAEINPLIALYDAGRYAELESRTPLLVDQYPDFGFGWKLLGGALQMQGKNALPAFQRAAELMPGEADAHYNLGVSLKSFGLLADAAASYRRALKIKPDYAEAHSNLGNILKDLRQLDDAAASYRRALALKTNSADAHSNLGTVLYELGQHDDALASFRRALELKPDSAGSHYNLGKILSELGQFDEAEACYRKAIEIQPDFAMAYYNLGNAMKDLGKLDDAVASYRRSLEIDPRFAEAYVNLGVSLQRQDRFSGAETCYRRALEIRPDLADAHINLGHVLRHLGQFNDAMTSYRRAMEINPDCLEATLGAGLLCMENGEMAEAESLFQKAVKINVHNLDARYLLAQVKKVKAGDENFTVLVAMGEAARNKESNMSDSDAISLHFALGKCFDDIGDHVLAFQHYIKGCELKRATFAYDPEQETQHISDIIRFFDRATIERLRGGDDPSPTPVFVLGMPRSGTTLTEQIIASHPDVYGAGELPDLLAAIHRGAARIGAAFPENMSALGRADIAVWAEDYVTGLRKRAPNAKRITDKAPANFLAIGLIHVMLPNAKIIHVNRNPVDTCLSCFTKLFDSKLEHTYDQSELGRFYFDSKLDYTYDLSELGRYYVDYARLMEHWRHVLPAGAFLDVRYEDIVADQETQARRIIAFCGLDWNDACVHFYNSKNPVRTASLTQVRQPIYGSSVNRWRRYEQFLGPLLDALGDLTPKRS